MPFREMETLERKSQSTELDVETRAATPKRNQENDENTGYLPL